MEIAENLIVPPMAKSGKLLKIPGVTFGLAIALGGTVGVGILRNPGGVAAQLGSVWLIIRALRAEGKTRARRPAQRHHPAAV